MIEAWKTKLNIGLKVGIIYMDLAKVLDSLNLELLIAKSESYGLDQNTGECLGVTSQIATSAIK